MAARRWLPIALGVLLVIVLAIGGMAAGCAYLVSRQVRVTEQSTPRDYERQSAAILARFEGVPPLFEDGPSGPTLSQRALTLRQKRPQASPLRHLHVLVFSRDEGKLVRLSLPFWLLRMAPDGHTGVGVDDADLDRLRLSVEDMDSAGPGPIIVRQTEDARVLVWAE